MYTAYRLNDPNEMMPPHKHTACAIRLGLTGQENFTGVEGENIVFGHGDMVLGHVLGSSAVNLLLVIGAMAMLQPLALPASPDPTHADLVWLS